jgi:glycosyltransferase involved in cell wall biosynthesis
MEATNLGVFWRFHKLIGKVILKFNLSIQPEDSLVAISISTFNAEDTIKDTLESLIEQSHRNWIAFICDDCSTDNTISRILEVRDCRVFLIKNKTNVGPYQNHNYNRLQALQTKAEFFTVIDHDDTATKDWLKNSLRIISLPRVVGVRPLNQRIDNVSGRVLSSYPAVNQTLWRRIVIEQVGAYECGLAIADEDFFQRAVRFCDLDNLLILLNSELCQIMSWSGENLSAKYTPHDYRELRKRNWKNATRNELYIPFTSCETSS